MQLNSGGAAAAGGTEYQALVTAWACTLMLSESVPPWDWPAGSFIRTVQCESVHEVDDLVISGDSGTAYVQAKHRVTLETSPASPFGKTIAQFVRQFLAGDGLQPDDRLLLVTSPLSSAPVTVELPRILERIRNASAASSVADVILSGVQRTLLTKLTAHISKNYSDAAREAIDDQTMLAVLRRMRIVVLDLEDAGAAEREALFWLRSALQPDVPVESAWAVLTSHCVELMRTRGSDTPVSLRDLMRSHRWGTNAAPSFAADVERLTRDTDLALTALHDLATIDGSHVTREVDAEIVARAREGSFLVTGEPGAGKSGVLWSLANAMRQHGPLVLLRADTISAQSLRELREDLELQHPVDDVLANWPSSGTGVLIVDALDAARGPAQRVLQDLIERAVTNLPNWIVVASIRRFDLQYNQRLKRSFPARDQSLGTFSLPEFAAVAHLSIPALTVEELQDFATQSAAVGAVLAQIGFDPLLFSPFNLRIIADLPRDAIDAGFSQDDLLAAFWSNRILADGPAAADGYERILRRTCNAMIARGRLLVNRTDLTLDEPGDASLAELLSLGILAEAGPPEAPRNRIAFSHHVLFDFAVSELILPDAEVDSLVGGDASLILRIRPSLQYWFRKLWLRSIDRFWQIAMQWHNAGVYATARLIPAQVAVSGFTSVDQFRPLLTRLHYREDQTARKALRTIVQAAVAEGDSLIRPEPRLRLWAVFTDALMADLDEEVALAARLLFWEMATQPLVGDTSLHAASAARAYFTWAIGAGKHGSFWLRQATQIIVSTFATEPAASEACLRVLTTADRLAEHGYEEAPSLARDLAQLGPDAADFVADCYVSMLSHHETSSEPTAMLTGVLSMSSNRRQDYDGAVQAIEEAFPAFIAAAPTQGVRVAVEMWRSYSESRQSYSREDIALVGSGGAVAPDSSYFVDFDDSHDEEVRILAHLRDWIRTQPHEVAAGVLAALTTQRVHAGVWAALIPAAPRTQDVVHALLPLLTTAECLTLGELTSRIGDAIVELHSAATVDDRIAIETTLIGLSDDDQYALTGDQFLARFEPDSLETVEARARRRDPEVGTTPPHRPFVSSWDSVSGSDGPYWTLRDAGVDTDEPYTRQMLDVARDLELELQPILDRETFDARIGLLRQLVTESERMGADLHDEARRAVWHGAANFTAAAARATWIADVDAATQHLLGESVLTALAFPVAHPREVEAFDESEFWSGNNPRITAVQAVFGLLHHGVATSALDAQVSLLCAASEVEVRRQAYECVSWVAFDRRPLVLSLVQTALAVEPSTVVLAAILRVAFQLKRLTDREGILSDLRLTMTRAEEMGTRGKRLRQSCVRHFVILDVWDDDPTARTEIDRIINRIPAQSKLVEAVIRMLREPLTPGPHTERNVAARIRATRIATDVVNRSTAGLATLRSRFEGQPPTAAAQKRYRQLLRHVDDISGQLFYACGAYNRHDEEPNAYANPRSLLSQYGPLLEALASATVPSTTHHTIQILAYGFESDPKAVLRLVCAAVDAGRNGGYEFDSMGLDLVMSVLRRFIAEERDMLRLDAEVLAGFIHTLDTFVDVGWGSAHNLSYSLDEVFR